MKNKTGLHHYINFEIPYKLNVLYTFVYWEKIYGLWKELEDLNGIPIYNSTLESSILFGRHILNFIGIAIDKTGSVKTYSSKDDDYTIVKLGIEPLSPTNTILQDNIIDITYLYKMANKRVAHVTEYSNNEGIIDKKKIKNAIEAIHDIVEDLFPIEKSTLLRYNQKINLTT